MCIVSKIIQFFFICSAKKFIEILLSYIHTYRNFNPIIITSDILYLKIGKTVIILQSSSSYILYYNNKSYVSMYNYYIRL